MQKLTNIYRKNGTSLKVNDHMVQCLKKGDATLSEFSLINPTKKTKNHEGIKGLNDDNGDSKAED